MEEAVERQWKLGALSHIGIVVRDMDEAIEYYSSIFGMGPFTTQVWELKDFLYRGKPANARVKAGIAYSGRVFVELVQVLEGETAHTEFFGKHGEGMQHVAFTVDDMDKALADLEQKGIKPIMYYSMPIDLPGGSQSAGEGAAGKRRFLLTEAYLDSGKVGGTVIQLMHFKPLPAA